MAIKRAGIQMFDGNLCRVGATTIVRIATPSDTSATWRDPDGMVTLSTTPCPACKTMRNHSSDYHRQFVAVGEDKQYLKYINTGSPW